MTPLQTTQAIYTAFGQGDIPAILSHVAEDVEWEYGPRTTDSPWIQGGRGHAAAVAFFQALSQIEITHFVPKTFLAGDGLVVVLVDVDFTVKATGCRVHEIDEAHLWTFNPAGQVAKFRHRIDSYAQHQAYHGLDC